jgi:hypothetical protein
LITQIQRLSSIFVFPFLPEALLLQRRLLALATTVAISGISGCAGLNVDPIDSTNGASGGLDDRSANGIRYYEPAYFLLVYSDAAGSVKTDVLVLPDTTRKMVAQPHSFLSKNKQVLSFRACHKISVSIFLRN